MLTIWTSASGQQVSKVFAPALRSFRPNVPPHKFLTLQGGLVTPAAGEVVLVCGNKTVDELRRAGIVHKSRTLSSLREKPVLKTGGGYWLVTFDPAITGTEFDKQELIEWDVHLAARLLRTGSVEPKLGSYRYVPHYDELIAWVEAQFEKFKKPVDVTLDLETMGFHCWYPDKDIVTISFTAKPETADVVYLGTKQKHPVELDRTGKLFDQVKWLLNSPKVKLKGANLKFDLIWIAEKWGIECTNFVFDTLLVGTLVNENRSNSLGGILSLVSANGWCQTEDQKFKTFREYIETEHGLEYRKATYWIAIYNALANSGVPWMKIKEAPWTKLKEIAKILTLENVDSWVEKAKAVNTLTLHDMVKKETDSNSSDSGETAETEKVTTKTFKVHAGQKEVIEAAIKKAKEVSGTAVDTVALAHICSDFLAGSGGSGSMTPAQQLAKLVASLDIEVVMHIVDEAFPDFDFTVDKKDEAGDKSAA